jgi:hypothetical protein
MIKRISLIVSFVLSFYFIDLAQCRPFIKAIAPEQLKPYILDGNFVAPVVYEGDKVYLTRTFLAGQHYKIMILGMDIWQKKITIKTQDGLVLFRNYNTYFHKDNCFFTDYQGNKIPCLGSNYFEFVPKYTTKITISVKIERKAKSRRNRVRGCLGIVVGFLPSTRIHSDTSSK